MRKTKKNKSFKFLGKGTYGKVFKAKFNKQNVALKFVKMKSKYFKDETHPANLEEYIGKYLNNLRKGVTPHIYETIGAINCDRKSLGYLDTFDGNDWYYDILSNPNLYEDVKVIISEYMDGNLGVLFKKNKVKKRHVIVILFQVCYTLVCIQNKLRNYRHNDLKPGNILFKRTKNTKKYYDIYIIMGIKFYVPCLPFEIKIADFDFSHSSKFKNQKIENFKETSFYTKGITPFTNPVYDIHYFINTSLSLIKNKNIRSYLLQFIPKQTIGPSNKYTRSHRLTSYHIDQRYNYVPENMSSAAELLLSGFNEFRKKPENLLVKNVYNSNIQLKNIKDRKDIFNII